MPSRKPAFGKGKGKGKKGKKKGKKGKKKKACKPMKFNLDLFGRDLKICLKNLKRCHVHYSS
jgi:hypothetical protein